jgi:hypothetical protein
MIKNFIISSRRKIAGADRIRGAAAARDIK